MSQTWSACSVLLTVSSGKPMQALHSMLPGCLLVPDDAMMYDQTDKLSFQSACVPTFADLRAPTTKFLLSCCWLLLTSGCLALSGHSRTELSSQADASDRHSDLSSSSDTREQSELVSSQKSREEIELCNIGSLGNCDRDSDNMLSDSQLRFDSGRESSHVCTQPLSRFGTLDCQPYLSSQNAAALSQAELGSRRSSSATATAVAAIGTPGNDAPDAAGITGVADVSLVTGDSAAAAATAKATGRAAAVTDTAAMLGMAATAAPTNAVVTGSTVTRAAMSTSTAAANAPGFQGSLVTDTEEEDASAAPVACSSTSSASPTCNGHMGGWSVPSSHRHPFSGPQQDVIAATEPVGHDKSSSSAASDPHNTADACCTDAVPDALACVDTASSCGPTNQSHAADMPEAMAAISSNKQS